MTVNPPAKQSGLSFTAVDVETANPQRASICAIGLAKVRDGQVVDTWSSLVRPHEEFAEFHSRNIDVHQIRPEDVAEAPAWDTIQQELSAFIQEDVIVAHSNSTGPPSSAHARYTILNPRQMSGMTPRFWRETC